MKRNKNEFIVPVIELLLYDDHDVVCTSDPDQGEWDENEENGEGNN